MKKKLFFHVWIVFILVWVFISSCDLQSPISNLQSPISNFVTDNTPPVVNNDSFDVIENATIGTLVDAVIASDADSEISNFIIISGNEGGAFVIDNRGQITTTALLDGGAITHYSLTIEVVDTAGNVANAIITITVTIINPACSVISIHSDYSLVDCMQIPIDPGTGKAIYSAIEMVPNSEQILVTDRLRKNIVLFKNGSFVKRLPVNIPNRELALLSWVSWGFGLWDIVFDPGFDTNEIIYLSMALIQPDTSNLSPYIANHTIVKGRYDINTENFVGDFSILFEESTRKTNSDIFGGAGGKILFLPDDTLLFTIGPHGMWLQQNYLEGQNLNSFSGKTIRMTRTGEPVCDVAGKTDNPFCDSVSDVTKYLYTLGHKNSQGLVLDPQTEIIYAIEHGTIGGDEINVYYPGSNYGFPHVCSGGCVNYVTSNLLSVDYPLSNTNLLATFTDPITVWNNSGVSVAPSGLSFYTNDGDSFLLVSTLGRQKLDKFLIDAGGVTYQHSIASGGRFRDVVFDGEFIYTLTDKDGGLVLKLKEVLPLF